MAQEARGVVSKFGRALGADKWHVHVPVHNEDAVQAELVDSHTRRHSHIVVEAEAHGTATFWKKESKNTQSRGHKAARDVYEDELLDTPAWCPGGRTMARALSSSPEATWETRRTVLPAESLAQATEWVLRYTEL